MAKYRHESDDEPKFIRELRKRLKKVTQELMDLKRENKMLRQLTAPISSPVEIIDEDEVFFEPVEKYEVRHQCPSCGSYTKNVFFLRDSMYYKCESCDSKGKIPQENK
jgi:hypothetical protein